MRRVVIILVAAGALSGCGSPDPASTDKPGIATLQSTAAKAPPVLDVEDKRPLIRADTSDDEINRMLDVWSHCLRDEGVPGIDVGHGIWKPTVDKEAGTHTAAYTACHVKEPESVMERLKRQDFEEYSDRYHAFVKCIQDAGVDVSADDDGPTIKFNHHPDAFDDRVTAITERCTKTTQFE